VCETTIIY